MRGFGGSVWVSCGGCFCRRGEVFSGAAEGLIGGAAGWGRGGEFLRGFGGEGVGDDGEELAEGC